jgi:serine/threonine-protein kinase
VSFWSKLKARFGRGDDPRADAVTDADADAVTDTDADTPAATPAVTPAATRAVTGAATGRPPRPSTRDQNKPSTPEDEIDRLASIGLPGGPTPEEVIAILRRARGTVREADAVAHVASIASGRPVPEPVRVACADILAARGDEAGALGILDGVTSTPGLILAADLFAVSGQLPRAVSTIERVLGRELDAPGARERHHRWRASLGYSGTKTGHLDEATIVAAPPTKSPFRLLREVARGGAGTVYEAEDELLARRVAFKVYHDRSTPAARELIEREARMAAALAGPGVVRVLDAGLEDGWIALEWAPRGSLRDILRAGDAAALLPIARWARPLARALQRVHAAGIVHADIKPANVLLRQRTEPVLSDFGIARPRGAKGEGGSPGYLSPERLGGAPSDPRDDIYGFGRILEDVLHLLSQRAASPGAAASPALDQEEEAALRALTAACLGPADARPPDGAALVRALP